jgi:hypothetical protein
MNKLLKKSVLRTIPNGATIKTPLVPIIVALRYNPERPSQAPWGNLQDLVTDENFDHGSLIYRNVRLMVPPRLVFGTEYEWFPSGWVTENDPN